MKARKVSGLDPEGTLADNAERVVRVRLDELCGFMPRAADPRREQALHDMRIAAKRLRYVLEITVDCFGPYAATAIKRTKKLQGLLGDIHDCDMQRPEVERLLQELRAEDLKAALDVPARAAPDLAAQLVESAPNTDTYDGLVALATALQVRRNLLFGRFLVLWRDLERKGFRARLQYAVAERRKVAPPASRSRSGNAAPVPDAGQAVSSGEPESRVPDPRR